MPDSPAVEVRGLVKRYRGHEAVSGMDLVARRGEITAVLGPNGAGKTTTIECCEGLRVPDAGSVRVLGLDPRAQARALRPRVGVMLQDGGLPTSVRPLELLRHVASMYAAPADVGQLAERLGITSYAGTSVRRLSGGQRQRLALAAALVGRPELVFLDEPSAGMDPQSRHAVWELIRELRTEGVSIVMTTHLMDEAEGLADKVVVVDAGRVIAEGTVLDLVRTVDDRTLRFSTSPALDVASLGRALTTLAAGAPGTAGTTISVQELTRGEYLVDGRADPAVIAALSAWCASHDLLVTRLTVGRRTLEDVFLDLTGRSLR